MYFIPTLVIDSSAASFLVTEVEFILITAHTLLKIPKVVPKAMHPASGPKQNNEHKQGLDQMRTDFESLF